MMADSQIHKVEMRTKHHLSRMDETITDLTKLRNDIYNFMAKHVRPGKINHCNGPMLSDLFLDSPLTGFVALRLHRGYMMFHETVEQLEESRRDAIRKEHQPNVENDED